MSKLTRLLTLLLAIELILVSHIQANLNDLDKFVEEQIQRIYEFSELQDGADKFPILIEKLSQKLNEKVRSQDPAIVSGIRRIIESEEEPEPSPVHGPSLGLLSSRSRLSFDREPERLSGLGLSVLLGRAEGASNPHIVHQNNSLSSEGLEMLKQTFDVYLREYKAPQVILDTYELALDDECRKKSAYVKFFHGSKVVIDTLKQVLENLVGEKDELSVPLLFLEQVPMIGKILRTLRENHSQHIASLIRGTQYAVEIANYITHRDGIKLEDIKRDGIDLLRRNSRVFVKQIVDSLVKVDDSSSSATKRYNMMIRLTYYIFVTCLSK